MNEPINTKTDQIVIFTLDELFFAIPLKVAAKVIHSIEIRYLPKAPEIIIGIINVRGQIIPVVDIRKRFGLKDREIGLNDRILIADTGKRQIAILADTVPGIRNLALGQLELAEKSLPFAEYLQGVAKIDDELILIYDIEQFLSLDEEKELEKALKIKNK